MIFPVKVPYLTSPSMVRYDGPLLTVDRNYKDLKIKELEKWGDDLYDNLRPDLVLQVSNHLGIQPTNDICELALQFDEDIAILDNGCLQAICFCFPSSWIPSERIGMNLEEIHSPVADGEILRRMSNKIAQVMSDQYKFRRFVWTISPTPILSNHPKIAKPEINLSSSINDLWFRTETQTTIPLGNKTSSIFLVKVETFPLSDYWNNLEQRKILLDSINSMSRAVLEYKNLTQIKELLNNFYEH